MKLIIFITLWAIVTPFPTTSMLTTKENGFLEKTNFHGSSNPFEPTTVEFLNKLRAFINEVVSKGWKAIEVSPLETIELDEYNLVIPTGLIYLDLKLKNISAIGLSDYIVHDSTLDVNSRIYDVDIEFPSLRIISELYDLSGNVYTAIPLYGKGRAEFVIQGFRFGAKLHLTKSENGQSGRDVIEDVENATFTIQAMKSNLSGVVGGSNVDAIVNALIDEVFLYYLKRFNDFVYRYVIKVMNIGPSGGIVGSLNRFTVVAEVLFDFNTDQIHLQEFSLTELGRIRVKLTGNFLVDWLATSLTNLFLRIFDDTIMNAVINALRTTIHNAIRNINSNLRETIRRLESFN